MRTFVTMVAGVATLFGAVALAQPAPSMPPTVGNPEEHMAKAHQEAAFFHLWIQRALREGKSDPVTLQLMTKALTDRTAMLQAELDHVAKFQALVTAVQGGSEDAVKTARENLKTSHEAVAAAAKVFCEDIKAIRDHIKSALPERPNKARPGARQPAESPN